jgi:hypothetical protein
MSHQSKSKKITNIDPKYFPPKQIGPDGKEIPYSDDPKTIAWIAEYAANAKLREQEAKVEHKRREEERAKIEQFEKQQTERNKQELEARSELPEQQLQSFVSGHRYKCGYCHLPMYHEDVCHNKLCPGDGLGTIDIEPGLSLLREEYSIGKLIRLDKQTHDRLVDFAKPDEHPVDLINRLLDIAASVAASAVTAAADEKK